MLFLVNITVSDLY